jgi:hypothetical protein
MAKGAGTGHATNVWTLDGTSLIARCEDGSFSEHIALGQKQANARLIAASPDLLEALVWAVAQIEDDLDPDHQQALASAKQAIKNATGE